MSLDLPLAIFHEVTVKEPLPRTPENDLVMNAEKTVQDYSDCGEEDGALFGIYLYNAYQISIRIKPGDRVVDLGCGSGRLLNIIAQWNPDVEFVGVDLAAQMLNAAREQANLMGLQNVRYQEGDFSRLNDLKENYADLIMSSMALHHLPDRAALTRCFSALDRVLRPGGGVYLMDFGRLRSSRAVEIFVSKVARTETEALSQDYRASLHAAFLPSDFADEAAGVSKSQVTLYRTVVAALVMIACTPVTRRPVHPKIRQTYSAAVAGLSPLRRAELMQMRLFLRLGGMEFPT